MTPARTGRILAAVLAVCLLACAVPASAAGTAEDSLVTESAALAWGEELLQDALSGIDGALAAVSGAGGRTYSLSDGDRLSLEAGSSVILVSGSARVGVSGTLVNATVGARASTGGLNAGQLYIVGGDSAAYVTAGGSARVLAWGGAELSRRTVVFSDVPAGSWYCDYVYAAVAAGLIDGVTDTTYEPDGGFTVAQAVKIAACLHQYYHTGSVTLQNGAAPWYSTYVDYAVANGICAPGYAAMDAQAMNSAINRRDFAVIFYNAMPAYEYGAINEVDSIPDVAAGDEGAEEIYALYRAGILDGVTADGAYSPGSGIRRSEAAAIVARMLDEDLRVTS